MVFEYLQKYTAEYAPRNLKTLKPEALGLIGQRMEVRALWEIEEGETYAGEQAMELLNMRAESFFWMPSGDLKDLQPCQS